MIGLRSAAVLAGGLMMAAMFLIATVKVSWVAALALPFVMAMGVVVLVEPFIGVFLITLLIQQGYWTRVIVPGIPLSYTDLLGVLTVAGLLLGTSFQRPRERWNFDRPEIRLVLMFLLVASASALLAQSRANAMSVLSSHWVSAITLVLVVSLTRNVKRLKFLIVALVASTTVSAGVALVDATTGTTLGKPGMNLSRDVRGEVTNADADGAADERQHGTANKSATASSHMMVAGVALATMLFLGTSWMRPLMGFALVVGIAGSLLTQARSGGLALGVVLIGIVIKYFRRPGFPAVVILASLIISLGLVLAPPFLWERFVVLAEEPDEDLTLQSRLGMARTGFELLSDNPLLGIGPGNFGPRSREFEYRWEPRGSRGKPLHNMYLSVSVEEGLLGIATFGSLIAFALVGLYRARDATGELGVLVDALQVALPTYLVACAFQMSEYYVFTWIMIGIALAAGRLHRHAQLDPPGTPSPMPSLLPLESRFV